MTSFAGAAGPSLLLISSSKIHGGGYLDHAEEELRDFFAGTRDALFVPFALHDLDAYASRAIERFAAMGIRMRSLHHARDPVAAVESADGFFVGGGNTFRLLRALREGALLLPIRRRVLGGARYAGASAGVNVAGPTIKTTNDMPIVLPDSLDALGLLPFQLNPHYLETDPASTHMGETREERIREFHEEPGNAVPVVGLREGALLRREGDSLVLKGRAGARLFWPDGTRIEYGKIADLSFLIRMKILHTK